MNKKQLQQMIEMLVESALIKEKDDAKEAGIDLGGDADTAPDDSSGDTGADAGSADTTGADAGAGDSGVELDGLNSEIPGGDAGLEPGADADATDVESGGSSGGFSSGGGGFSGGGGGFGSEPSGSDTEDGGDADLSDDESNDSDVIGDSMPLDPIQDTVDLAVKLSQEIGDHQIILNVVKSKMQKYFPDFDDAIPIIQGLWDTNDPNLKIVARKLIMFIKGD